MFQIGCGVYSRAAFIGNFSSICGVIFCLFVCVAVNFLTQLIFIILLFFGMVRYANKF